MLVPMRADRLVATLLLLQAKGRVTAAEVAEELEVSVKTARRDLEALAMAGVPVYSQAGRNGGWTLVGGARTDLTGLQADEARALFLAVGSSAPTSDGLKQALRKLVQAVPEPFRADAAAAVDAVVVDPTRWSGTGGTTPLFLDDLQKAVIERKQIELGYNTPKKGPSTRRVHPLGLVVKASVWYLIGDTAAGERVFRVDRVTSAVITDDPAVRPNGFDLQEAWNKITVAFDDNSRLLTATGLAEPWTLSVLRHILGNQLEVGDPAQDGRHPVKLSSYSPQVLASQVAGLASGLEVDGPVEVVEALAEIGARLVDRYRE